MAAGDAVAKGTDDFTEQPKQTRWQRGRGWETLREWQGPLDESQINTVTAAADAAGAEEIAVVRGWPTVITAAIPSGPAEDVDTEWSLEPYDLNKSLASHGIFNESGNSPIEMATIEAELKKGNADTVDYNARWSRTYLNDYAKLRGQGVDEYLSHAFVLRGTAVYERDAAFQADYQLVSASQGKIITWDEIGVPDDALIVRPWVHMYVSSLWTLPIKGGSNPGWADVYFDEWMVKPPAIRFVKQGRVRKRQLVREYIGAVAWSATLYNGGKGVP